MIAILKIGSSTFAFKKAGDATKALELLSGAQLVEYKYRSEAGSVYFPADEKRQRWNAVSVEMVHESALFSKEPADDEPLPEQPPARRRGLQLPPPAEH